jgi:phage tail-like protein
MADQETERKRVYPHLGHRFSVTVESLEIGSFSEVSGLEARVATETFEEGGTIGKRLTFPTRVEFSNVVLRRGLSEYEVLIDWLDQVIPDFKLLKPTETLAGLNPLTPFRKTVWIHLLDGTGEQVSGWKLTDAYPVRWSGPELHAQEGTVAVEELELTHAGISKVGGLG